MLENDEMHLPFVNKVGVYKRFVEESDTLKL